MAARTAPPDRANGGAGSAGGRADVGRSDLLVCFAYRPAACLGGATLLAVMALTVLDVVLRYLFNAPVRGTFELTELAMVAIAVLGLGHSQHRGEHIAIDLVYDRLPAIGRAALDVLVGLIGFVLVVATTWQLERHHGRMAASGEVTAVLGLPVYPIVAVAAVGFALFGLALLRDLAGACRRAVGRDRS